MSIVKKNDNSKKSSYLGRFAKLAKSGFLIFHTGDLANLWQIKNTHNLHMTVKRYVDRGLLVRIYRGMYALDTPDKLNPELLGLKALHRMAYISAENVLAEAGIIQQKIHPITLISSISKKFSIGKNSFYSRKLADRFLYNEIGLLEKDGIKKAVPERAIADMLYFNPRVHFDAERVIDWQKVKTMQKAIGYPLTFNRYKK